MIDLKKLYSEHPNCFDDSAKFEALLRNSYPQEKGMIYILSVMLSEGVLDLIKRNDTLSVNRFYSKLEDVYGFDQAKMAECYKSFEQIVMVNEVKTTVTVQKVTKPASAKTKHASQTAIKSNKELKYPKFSESYIRSKLASPKFFVRGKSYFNQGKVFNLECDSSMTTFESDVYGSYDNIYHCVLQVNQNELEDYDCECQAYASIPGPCKHIVATMLAITEKRQNAERKVKEEKEKKKLEAERKAMSIQQSNSEVLCSGFKLQEKAAQSNSKTVEPKQGKNSNSSTAPKETQCDNTPQRNHSSKKEGKRKLPRWLICVVLMAVVVCSMLVVAYLLGERAVPWLIMLSVALVIVVLIMLVTM